MQGSEELGVMARDLPKLQFHRFCKIRHSLQNLWGKKKEENLLKIKRWLPRGSQQSALCCGPAVQPTRLGGGGRGVLA